MPTCIALLRGINVGGNNPLPMRELAAHLQALGHTHVKTYIQSGNAVFNTPRKSPAALGKQIADRIESHHGFRPRVLILNAAELKKAADDNPFPEGEHDPKTLHLFFLAAPAKSPDRPAIEAIRLPSEQFKLTKNVFYLYAPDGIGRSKLAAKAEKLLGVECTARNWRTVQKLRELSDDPAP